MVIVPEEKVTPGVPLWVSAVFSDELRQLCPLADVSALRFCWTSAAVGSTVTLELA